MPPITRAAYLKLGAAAAILGAIAATAISFTLPRRYVSTAVIRFTPQAVPDGTAWQIDLVLLVLLPLAAALCLRRRYPVPSAGRSRRDRLADRIRSGPPNAGNAAGGLKPVQPGRNDPAAQHGPVPGRPRHPPHRGCGSGHAHPGPAH